MNYLKLDVFFGALKYSELTQQKAYDIVSFFSMYLVVLCIFLDLCEYHIPVRLYCKRTVHLQWVCYVGIWKLFL